jgi:hypothetical protein
MKRLLLFFAALFFALPVSAARPLGWNLEEVTNFNTSHYFCDMMKETGRNWSAGGGASGLVEDSNGWPTSMVGGVNAFYSVTTRIDQLHADFAEPGDVAHYPTGQYTIKCDGTAKVGVFRNGPDLTYQCSGTNTHTFNVAATTGEGLEFRVYGDTISNTGGPELFKVHASGTNPEACDPATDLLTPTFKRAVAGSYGARFMDWLAVFQLDTIVFMEGRNWAVRRPIDSRTYASSDTVHSGVPYEIPILVANEIYEDTGTVFVPWITVPVSMNDNFATGFAAYIAATLNPALMFGLEWCNECWNTGGSYIDQFRTVRAQISTHDGTATSGTTTTIVQTGAGWTINQHAGVAVCADDITNNNSTSCGVVLSNTADTITTTSALGFDVDAGDVFRVYPGTGSEADWVKRRHAHRSVELFDIFDNVIDLAKMKRIIGGQQKDCCNPSDANTYLNYDPPGATYGPVNDYVDWFAVAPYGALGESGSLKHSQNATSSSYDGVTNSQCGTNAALITDGGGAQFACCPSSCVGIRAWTPAQFCASLQVSIASMVTQIATHVTAVEAHTNIQGNTLRVVLYEGGMNHDDRVGGSQTNVTGEWDPTLVAAGHAAHRDACMETVLNNYWTGIYAAIHNQPMFMYNFVAKWSKFRQFGFAEYLVDADNGDAICEASAFKAFRYWSAQP